MGNQLPKYNDNNEYGLNVYVITDDSNFKKETLEEIFNIKIPMSEVSFSCTQSNLYDSPIMPNLKVNHFGVFPSENIKHEAFETLFTSIQASVQSAQPKTENNLILCFASTSSSKLPKELITNLSELYGHYHPLIIFVSPTPNELKVNVEIDYLNYDKKMLTYIDSKKDLTDSLRIAIFKEYCYYSQYHELDSFNPILSSTSLRRSLEISKYLLSPKAFNSLLETNYSHCINLMVVGRPGVGKSTLINAMLGRRKCKESVGSCITNQLRLHKHSDFNISLFDTPGFENKDGVEKMKNIINYYTDANANLNYNIHLVLFLVNSSTRTLLDGDEEFIRFCLLKKLPIIFVLTRCESLTKSKESQTILEHDLNKIEISLSDKIYCLQLKNENDKKIVSFGFDELMEKINEVMKGCKSLGGNYFLPNNQKYENIVEKGTRFSHTLISYFENEKEFDEYTAKWIIKAIGCAFGLNFSLILINNIFERWNYSIGKTPATLRDECILECKEMINEEGVVKYVKRIMNEYNEGINDLLNLKNYQN